MPTKRVFLKRLRDLGDDQTGSFAIWGAIAIVVIMGFAALALDVGHLVTAKSELEKAADAGALAGARALNLIPPYPNFTNSSIVATATVKENKVNQNLITDCAVQVGYWDLTWKSGSAPANLLPTGTTPSATQLPACKVTLSKSSGNNGGPLTMWFAQFLGVKVDPLSASAVATMVAQSPVVNIPAGDAFPVATPISWVKQMWNPNADSASFRIGSAYHSPDGGQWTSFLIDANDVPTIRSLIDNGNPTPLKIGDNIYIEPGTKTTLYSEAATKIGQTVLLPIVCDSFDTHAWTPLLAWVPFYIEDAQGGSGKYIQGHFVAHYNAPSATGSSNAPNYGAIGYNAKLVN
jgi:Flp pilus assembly protein TadG